MPIKKLYQFLSVLIVVFYFNTQVSAGPVPLAPTLTNDGGCYYVPTGTAYSPFFDTPPEEAQCSCYSAGFLRRIYTLATLGQLNWAIPLETGIYYGKNMWGDNWILRGPDFRYERSLLDESANLRDCEAAQPARVFSSTTKTCYKTVNECKNEIWRSCTGEGTMYLYWQNPTNSNDKVKQSFNSSQENAKREEFKECVVGGNSNEACLNKVFGTGLTSRKYDYSNIYRCGCETPWACGIIPGASCEKICLLSPAGFSKIAFQEKVDPYNPLLILKIGVDTLFYFAVFLFIINLLSAGFEYIRSGGEADKLKEAKTRLTNTIFGFIFILLVSTIINYVVTLFEEQILIEDSTTQITRDEEDKEV